MGTRADFYVGVGLDAEWIGSIAFDGYEWAESPDCPLMRSQCEGDFRNAVALIAKGRDDWTPPELGWPWPWKTSSTTDYTYAFADGQTKAMEWGGDVEWPDMTSRQNVATGKRSGMLIITSKPDGTMEVE